MIIGMSSQGRAERSKEDTSLVNLNPLPDPFPELHARAMSRQRGYVSHGEQAALVYSIVLTLVSSSLASGFERIL